jgi:hypothetical protein
VRRAGAACAAAVTTGVLIGVSMGAWLGWRIALLVAVLMGWRLRFRPSAMARVWRRQAAVQRHTAGMLVVLEHEGYLVLHDTTVPGWPTSLDHLVVGSTGTWVINSWRPSWLGLFRDGSSLKRARRLGRHAPRLRGEAAAVADALAGDASTSVRPLVCVPKGRHAAAHWSAQGIPVATPRRLADVVRRGSRVQSRAAAPVLAITRRG